MPPIENLCLAGVVPVLPSLAEDEEEEGQLLNVNADTAAAAVAQALQAEKLVFLTDTPGILARQERTRQPDPGSDPRRVPRPDRQGRDRQGDDPQGRGLPDQPRSRASARPTSSTAGSATRCCWRSSPRAASAPRSSGTKQAAAADHGPVLGRPDFPEACPERRCQTARRSHLTGVSWSTHSQPANQSSQATIAQFDRYVIPNYRRFPVCLVRGEGSWVWDAEGNRYLDFFPGWGCNLRRSKRSGPAFVGGRTGVRTG